MITLYEILELINDSCEVQLYNNNADLIASYDGKESIDEEYNEYYVTDMYSIVTTNNKYSYYPALVICIDLDSEEY